MYQGKHRKRSRRKTGKSIALLVSLLLIVCVAVGGTIAFLMDTDGPLDNLFNPSQVTTSVTEDITTDTQTKQNVSIKNTGDTEAYIRAAVVVTWQDENGNVYGKAPVAETDYDIIFDLNSGWEKSTDGFYYWTKPVLSVEENAEECSTGVLITSCTSKNTAPEGYFLNVEIIGSGIQSKPDRVVETEWDSGVSSVSADGTLNIK